MVTHAAVSAEFVSLSIQRQSAGWTKNIFPPYRIKNK